MNRHVIFSLAWLLMLVGIAQAEGIDWQTDLEAGKETAAKENKLVIAHLIMDH